jgi:hypothetical protein
MFILSLPFLFLTFFLSLFPSIIIGTKKIAHNIVTIDFDTIRKIKYSDYSKLMYLTIKEYQGYAAAPAGLEHYALLAYFSNLFIKHPYSYLDIGTRYGTSALALASTGHSVITIDLPTSSELTRVYNEINMPKIKWEAAIIKENCNLTVVNADLLQYSDEEFEIVHHAPFMLLDTFHRPYTVPFEREFIQRLVRSHYTGIVLLDDIHENDEMEKWFKELYCDHYRPFSVYDITPIGHASGTGLLDFSSRVKFIGAGSETEKILMTSSDNRCSK